LPDGEAGRELANRLTEFTLLDHMQAKFLPTNRQTELYDRREITAGKLCERRISLLR
jgi:hypothetical protein